MFNHRVGITSDNTAFKPGHDFTDNRDVIVNSKEREIWHFGIDICIDAFFVYGRTKYDVGRFPLKDGS